MSTFCTTHMMGTQLPVHASPSPSPFDTTNRMRAQCPQRSHESRLWSFMLRYLSGDRGMVCRGHFQWFKLNYWTKKNEFFTTFQALYYIDYYYGGCWRRYFWSLLASVSHSLLLSLQVAFANCAKINYWSLSSICFRRTQDPAPHPRWHCCSQQGGSLWLLHRLMIWMMKPEGLQVWEWVCLARWGPNSSDLHCSHRLEGIEARWACSLWCSHGSVPKI